MDITITNTQCDRLSNDDEIVKLFLKTITKNPYQFLIPTFRKAIDNMLLPYKTSFNTTGDQYTEELDVLIKYFNFDVGDAEKKLSDHKMVFTKNGWHSINKLNTNYSDISVLVKDILLSQDKCLLAIIDNIKKDDWSDLIELAKEIELDGKKYYNEFLSEGKYRSYVKFNKKFSVVGTDYETSVIDFLESKGHDLIYHPKEGSYIDTILGVDFIMKSSKDGKPYFFQVKGVGSIKYVKETPCDLTNTDGHLKKIPGGYLIFKRNNIKNISNYVHFLVFVSGKKILGLKKYQPIEIESITPLVCVNKEIHKFPTNNTYIDIESVVFSNIPQH